MSNSPSSVRARIAAFQAQAEQTQAQPPQQVTPQRPLRRIAPEKIANFEVAAVETTSTSNDDGTTLVAQPTLVAPSTLSSSEDICASMDKLLNGQDDESPLTTEGAASDSKDTGPPLSPTPSAATSEASTAVWRLSLMGPSASADVFTPAGAKSMGRGHHRHQSLSELSSASQLSHIAKVQRGGGHVRHMSETISSAQPTVNTSSITRTSLRMSPETLSGNLTASTASNMEHPDVTKGEGSNHGNPETKSDHESKEMERVEPVECQHFGPGAPVSPVSVVETTGTRSRASSRATTIHGDPTTIPIDLTLTRKTSNESAPPALSQDFVDQQLLFSFLNDLASLVPPSPSTSTTCAGSELMAVASGTLTTVYSRTVSELASRMRTQSMTVESLHARLAARDLYLSNTIVDSARRTQELERCVADLRWENERLEALVKGKRQDGDEDSAAGDDEALKIRVEGLESSIAELTVERNDLSRLLESARLDDERNQEDAQEVMAELERMEEKCEEMRLKGEIMARELAEAKEEAERLRVAAAGAAQVENGTQTANAEGNDGRQTFNEEIAWRDAEIRRYAEEAAESRRRIEQESSHVKELQSIIEQLKARVSALESEKDGTGTQPPPTSGEAEGADNMNEDVEDIDGALRHIVLTLDGRAQSPLRSSQSSIALTSSSSLNGDPSSSPVRASLESMIDAVDASYRKRMSMTVAPSSAAGAAFNPTSNPMQNVRIHRRQSSLPSSPFLSHRSSMISGLSSPSAARRNVVPQPMVMSPVQGSVLRNSLIMSPVTPGGISPGPSGANPPSHANGGGGFAESNRHRLFRKSSVERTANSATGGFIMSPQEMTALLEEQRTIDQLRRASMQQPMQQSALQHEQHQRQRLLARSPSAPKIIPAPPPPTMMMTQQKKFIPVPAPPPPPTGPLPPTPPTYPNPSPR